MNAYRACKTVPLVSFQWPDGSNIKYLIDRSIREQVTPRPIILGEQLQNSPAQCSWLIFLTQGIILSVTVPFLGLVPIINTVIVSLLCRYLGTHICSSCHISSKQRPSHTLWCCTGSTHQKESKLICETTKYLNFLILLLLGPHTNLTFLNLNLFSRSMIQFLKALA